MLRIQWIYLVFILAVALLLVACGDADSGATGEAEVRVTPVVIAAPERREIDYVLSALGSVESIHDPTVSAETSGQVIEIAVREGGTVSNGDLLVALDATLHQIETAKAKAELRRSEVLLDNQRKEVDRLQRLDESQSVSRDQLEDEEAQLEILGAQRDVARKQWEQAVYLESKTRVKAPLSGLVTRRHVSPGDYVSSGESLIELVSTEILRARIAFPEHDASRIRVGQQVRLTSPAAPRVLALGEVTAVNPQIKMHNRAVEVMVEFENPGGWLPGASVDATLVIEQREDAVTVPAMALVNRSGREVVFVVEAEHVRAVPVESGWREDDWVEVLKGITLDDQVVVEGASLLSEGSKVRPTGAKPVTQSP